MTLQNSSRKQFTSMFWQSAKKTCFFPIAAFVILLISTFSFNIEHSGYHYVYGGGSNGDVWGYVPTGLAISAFIVAGVIDAFVIFSACFSKKQNNVLFSLGMKKTDIFLAKVAGGIVPMTVAVIAAAVFEIMSYSAQGEVVTGRYLAVAVLNVLVFIMPYILAFLIAAAVSSGAGNAAEAAVFFLVIAAAPTFIQIFLEAAYNLFTLGAYWQDDTLWRWVTPFFPLPDIDFSYIFINYMEEYFTDTEIKALTGNDFSGVISAAVCAAAAFAAGIVGFCRRRNEITGTWGRAKLLNEICGALVGFYTFSLFINYRNDLVADGKVSDFFWAALAFVISVAVFRLIFSNKRKKELRAALGRCPAYLTALGIACLVFSLGLFGYSSKVPEVSEIKYVEISTDVYYQRDDSIRNSASGALVPQNRMGWGGAFYYSIYDNYGDMAGGTTCTFVYAEEFKAIRALHQSYIDDGKIKNSAADACRGSVLIKYYLQDGKTVTRYYSETNEETFKKLLELNNLEACKNNLINEIATNKRAIEDQREYAKENNLLFDDSGYSSFSTWFTRDLYLFPTDMAVGHNIGKLTDELYEALVVDMRTQNSKEIFLHPPKEELGIISFGLSDNEGVVDKNVKDTSWNIGSYDIRTVVVTSGMKNTVRYLEKNGLLKYFEKSKSADDVEYVKLATMGQLYGEGKRSGNLPLFYGVYWNKNIYDVDSQYDYFRNVHNEITNREIIQKLMDNSYVYGFCSNDSRIMQIVYKNGDVSTLCVPGDVYRTVVG